ncbi:MATE family efflux transporter [Shewanella donghaensis]|uniref:MATE family efflux transporter n=1 Tax=Shewanella donghaensis TaxID=238836 RepID=UPI00118304A3|nr:MATE family efflux transporter [Shewanella donghaensis]
MSLFSTAKVNPENVNQHFWKYAIPSIAAMLVSGLYQIIDGMFVGHYIGFEGLAGINLAWPIIACIIGVGMMIGMGAGSLLSISRGENDYSKAQSVISNALFLVIIFSVLAAIFIHFFGDNLLLLQKAEGHNYAMALDYIDVFAYGAFFTTAATALPLLIRNDENPAIATQLMMLGAVINIGLDYLLIAVIPLGLQGAAIATLISQAIVVMLGISYFYSSKSNTKIQFNLKSINQTQTYSILKLGVSSLFMFMYFSFIIALHNYLFMLYGSAIHVAAFAIIGYIATLFYLLAEGIASGMQPPVSYYYGAKQVHNIKATVILALKLVCALGLTIVVVLNIFPEMVVHFFSQGEAELMAETLIGIRLHLFALILDGIIFVTTMYFMAVNQGGKSLTVSFGNMLIQIPFLIILPMIFGVNGIWLAVPLSNIALCIILTPMLLNEVRRINLLGEQQAQIDLKSLSAIKAI